MRLTDDEDHILILTCMPVTYRTVQSGSEACGRFGIKGWEILESKGYSSSSRSPAA